MKELYEKKNNIFQSEVWRKFQESLGRKIVSIGGSNGFELELPFRKKYIWFPKGPEKVNDHFLKEVKRTEAVFIRVEPSFATKGMGVRPKILTGQMSPYVTRILKLDRPDEKILSEMKPRVRYNIRLAERKGLKVTFSTDPSDAAKLYEILKSTESRNKGYSAHEREYYLKLASALLPSGFGKLAFGYYKKKLIYAGIFSVYGETAVFMHSGFTEEEASLKAPNFCLWQIMLESKRMGAKYFDMWGIAENDDPKHPWRGISDFKASFGGEVVRFPGSFDVVNSYAWYYIFVISARIRKLIKR